MNRIKRKLLLVILLLFNVSLLLSGCDKDSFQDKFSKVKVGMKQSEVYDILGDAEDVDKTMDEAGYLFSYWFVGASSMEDAQAKTNNNKKIKYYLVIFERKSGIFYVSEVDTGIWGV